MLADAIAAHPEAAWDVLAHLPEEHLSTAGQLDVAARTNNLPLLAQLAAQIVDGTNPLARQHLTPEARRTIIEHGSDVMLCIAIGTAGAATIEEIVATRARTADGHIRQPYLRRLALNPNTPTALVREALDDMCAAPHALADILAAHDLHQLRVAPEPQGPRWHESKLDTYTAAGSFAQYLRQAPYVTSVEYTDAVAATHDPDVYRAVVATHATSSVLLAALENEALPAEVHRHAISTALATPHLDPNVLHAAARRWKQWAARTPDDLLEQALARVHDPNFLAALCATAERAAHGGPLNADLLPANAVFCAPTHPGAAQVRALITATVDDHPALRNDLDCVATVFKLAPGFNGTLGEMIRTAVGIAASV